MTLIILTETGRVDIYRNVEIPEDVDDATEYIASFFITDNVGFSWFLYEDEEIIKINVINKGGTELSYEV